MNEEVEKLANALDAFAYDYDPYGYHNSFDSREEGYQNVLNSLLSGDIKGIREYLLEVIDEEDSFQKEAQELLDRLDDAFYGKASVLDQLHQTKKPEAVHSERKTQEAER